MVSTVLALGAWEFYARIESSPFVPPVGAISEAWVSLWNRGEIASGVQYSLVSVSIGLTIAITVGFVCGIAMARVHMVEVILRPYVNILQATPIIATVPVLAVLFGSPRQIIVAAIVKYCVFDVLENARMGAMGTSANLLEMGRAFGVGRRRQFIAIVLPSALHLTMTGVGLAVSKAFKGAILGELLITVVGLGGRIRYYGAGYRMPELYALTGTTIALAVLASTATAVVATRLARRYPMALD